MRPIFRNIFSKKSFINRFLYGLAIGLLLFPTFAFSQKNGQFTVVLDAGHGGKDPGKVVGKIYEKDIALNIVLDIGKILEANPDINVIYTRKTDVFVDLYERGAIANKAKADLFVSVHCNAHKTAVQGAETFVLGLHVNERNFEVAKAENEVIYLEDNYEAKYAEYNINSPESFIGLSIMQEEFLEQSIQLAKYIQDNFTNKMKRANRGVKQAGFIVLHQTYMPSVLIETGFITNENERKYLVSSKGQNDFAKNIADAVLQYKDWIGTKSIVSVPAYDPTPTPEASAADTNIVYRVQIATSSKKLETKAYNFKGLSPIVSEKNGGTYRYLYGNVHLHKEAQNLLAEARKKGYKDAFLVAYVNGVKTPVAEARKKEK
ncbi:MAG: N-acetylmuramoyl-L-alanine amidase [Capnocytophaga sp.]|nr:N-acetylmuramoyl-L-alanine amidase [Capnocytophaga sp.]